MTLMIFSSIRFVRLWGLIRMSVFGMFFLSCFSIHSFEYVLVLRSKRSPQ